MVLAPAPNLFRLTLTRRHAARVAVFALALLFIVSPGAAADRDPTTYEVKAYVAPSDRPGLPRPRPVYVGIYPSHIPEIDLGSNSYLVDFWIWFRWQGDDIDPSESFEFMNLYEGWDVHRQPVYHDEEGRARRDPLGGGWFYQVFRVQARFTRPFDVRRYPFDRQAIVIAIEDTDLTTKDMRYVADQGTETIDPELSIPGWRIRRVEPRVIEAVYPTNWGDTRRAIGADRYTNFKYTIHIERPIAGYVATTILPIAIVVLITLVIFLVDPKYFEARLGLGITSLISAVALQLTTSGDLPKVGYLVLLDHVYNLSYLVIFLSLLGSVMSVRLHDAGRTAAAKRLDRWGLAGMLVVFFGGVGLVILLR